MGKIHVSIGIECMECVLTDKEIEYQDDLQNGIDELFNGIHYFEKNLREDIEFVKINSDLLKFVMDSAIKNCKLFTNRQATDDIIYEYSCKCFKNVTREFFNKNIDKNEMARFTIKALIYDDFRKVEPLKKDISEKILNCI